jgi:hypothetical protein
MGKLENLIIPLLLAIGAAALTALGWLAVTQFDAVARARTPLFEIRGDAVAILYPGGRIGDFTAGYLQSVRDADDSFPTFSRTKECDASSSFSCDIHSFRIYADARGWCEGDVFAAGFPQDQMANAVWITGKFANRGPEESPTCPQLMSGMANLRSPFSYNTAKVNQTDLWSFFQCIFSRTSEDCRL